MIGQLQMVAYLTVVGAFVVGMWRLAYRFATEHVEPSIRKAMR